MWKIIEIAIVILTLRRRLRPTCDRKSNRLQTPTFCISMPSLWTKNRYLEIVFSMKNNNFIESPIVWKCEELFRWRRGRLADTEIMGSNGVFPDYNGISQDSRTRRTDIHTCESSKCQKARTRGFRYESVKLIDDKVWNKWIGINRTKLEWLSGLFDFNGLETL